MMKFRCVKLVWCVVLLLTVLPVGAVLAEDVVFADPDMAAAVRNQLGIADSVPITVSDMETMLSLIAIASSINNIEGLEHAVNLDDLILMDNGISDISAIAGLSNLSRLALDRNFLIEDISAVSGLTNLNSLYLRDNQIEDISAVSGLTNLGILDLERNRISDISDVSELTSLTSLSLMANSISDISAVSELTNLNTLYLSTNQISDISAISSLTNLTELALSNNQITDISALSGLTNVESLHLYRNNITDVSGLTGLANLQSLELDRNQIEVLDLSGSNFSSLRLIRVYDNPLREALLVDAEFNQMSFSAMMRGLSNISYTDGLLKLDMSGVDFAGILDLSKMYGMDYLEELLLAGAVNLDGDAVFELTAELDSLNWLDVTGLWDTFDLSIHDQLNEWDALPDNTLVIPEPATLLLFGLGGLVLRKRRS